MQQLHGKPQSEVTTKPFRSVTAPRGTQQNSQTVALHRLPPGPTFLGEGATSDFAEWSPRVRNDVGAVVHGMAGPTGQIPDATLYQIYYLYAARTDGEETNRSTPPDTKE